MAAGFPCAALSSDNWVGLAIWCAAVVVAIAVLGVGLLWAKKYATRSMKGRGQAGGELTIEKLEEMHRSGLISREEFSSLRRAALGLGPGAPGKAPPVRPAPESSALGKRAGGDPPGPSKSDLTDGAPDVDEDKKSQPPGEPPAQA